MMNPDNFSSFQTETQARLLNKAIALLPLSMGAESLAIALVWFIFGNSVFDWYKIAIVLMSLRLLTYFFLQNDRYKQKAFILTNILSMLIWSSLSLYCIHKPEFEIIKIALIIVGISAGAITFLAYFQYLYIVYGFFTLGFFAISMMLHGGVLLYIGLGLLILFIYLASLSMQYHELLKKYFDGYEQNGQLIRLEREQVRNLRSINTSIKNSMAQRAQIENKILESNDLIHHSIQNMLRLENETRRDLDFLLDKIEHGVLFIDNKNKRFHPNRLLLETWGLNEQCGHSLEALKSAIEHEITGAPVFSLNFPYPIKKNGDPIILQRKNGAIYEAKVSCFEDDLSTIYLWVFRDISEEQTIQELAQLALYDNLTMLPTRRMLYLKLEEYMRQHRDTDKIFALAFMDINHFKLLNDSLGHQAGNELLITFANRLKQAVGPDDFVGRMGGDEFICIFPNLSYKSDIEPIIEHLTGALQESIVIEGRSFILKSSIGVSFYPCDTNRADNLITFADMAMYKAKEKRGTILYQRYFPQFSKDLATKHHLSQDLKSALINNAFYLVFQPIYSIKDKDWSKVEVLLRWREHAGPDVFIPLASEIGLMPEIGLWVLEQACKMRLELAKITNKPIKFSVNISAEQIVSAQEVTKLLDLITQSTCPPEWLEFELTESLLFDMDKASNFIAKIKELGITVAIDDFGTGYSSFSYLKNLHFDTIKIDKQFLKSMFTNPREMSLVHSFIEIGHSLNAEITVEGVETKEHFEFCEQHGCHYIQGFYIAKPCDLASLVDKLETNIPI